jgi:hypothetical protein
MATSYYLSVGYLSGYSFQGGPDAAWEVLKWIVERLRHEPSKLVAEARRLGAPERCARGCCDLRELAERYGAGEDLTLTVVERVDEDDAPVRYIRQVASGDRMLKEHVRRAFCRLVIEEAHREGIEVDLTVS